ncbi:MAG: flagellar hook-basal body protein [Bryobacteraceae bacterium]
MDPLMVAVAAGMRSRMEALEMLANNLANAGTAGFKLDRESYSLYVAPEALEPALAGEAPMPGLLPVIERHWTDFRQGALVATGNPTDLAISGPGFFVVEGPKGPLYTRNGAFRWSAAGELVTAEGYAVRAVGGARIRASGQGAVEVSAEGVVRQGGQVLGRLEIVRFAAPQRLLKMGNSYFRAAEAAEPAAGYAIEQGKLENSNVSAPESAVRLIAVLRQFEMLQRAAMLGSEMNRRAVEELARVSP